VDAETNQTLIRLTKSGTAFSGSREDLKRLRLEFDERHYLRFSGLLEPELIGLLQHQIAQGEFYENVHEAVESSRELCMKENAASSLLFFLLNRDALFRIIQEITQCGHIGCFTGRIYRLVPGCGHTDGWHNDIVTVEQRLLGLSINLGAEAYAGGTLQIRDRKSGRILDDVVNLGCGDAILFRLSPRLEHRLTEVEGEASKTAFAGWFRGKPDFLSLIRGAAANQAQVSINATLTT
jgi:hypothetical protein